MLHRWQRAGWSCTAVGLVCTFVALNASAADRDAWKHPDSRFAAVDDAVDDDDYSTAQKLLAELRAEAKRKGDHALLTESLETGKEVARLSREFGKISKYVKTLKERPKNGKASLAVGKYYCVVKGNWSRGLALLASGEDATLAALAAGDTSGNAGYWVTDNGKDGWASIHFAEFPPAK
jgi:hypothetical protein